MKVIVFVKATAASEAGQMPGEDLLTAMMQYNQQLVDAGIMLGGEGLHPSTKGVRVLFSGKNRTVKQGPFAHTSEIVAGYWLWQVKSMEEAIEWVKRCPNPMLEDSEIEIRPAFGPEDFGEALTPELREQEARMRALVPEPDRWEKKPARHFAGISRSYSHEDKSGIPAQWQEFLAQIGKIPNRTGKDCFGICVSASEAEFEYFTAVEVGNTGALPTGVKTVDLPAQHYAVFLHTGHVSQLSETMQAICTKWIPASGLPVAPDSPWYERYTEEFNPDTGVGGIEIWAPIQS